MFKHRFFILKSLLVYFFILGCEPLVNTFDDVENGMIYSARHIKPAPVTDDTLVVVTWNIRFGAGRIPWFGDSCGDRVILSEAEVLTHLEGIAAKLNEIDPDIVFLQEVDVKSKRTGYIDEVQWLLDNTHLNYGAYASMWEAQVIPSDGLGRVNTGNAVLSRWEITKAERIQLPLRGDQDTLTRYFYLRRNILKTKINIPGVQNFYAVNIHTSAFAADDTKKKHIDRFKMELDRITESGALVVAGGDLNEIPPGSDKTDYCMEDKCYSESFHAPGDDPEHKEGSNFTPEITWLQELYDTYPAAVSLEDYAANQSRYFTHTPDWSGFWDRKLDYLFANYEWIAGSDSTHQDATDLSDHCPVSAKLMLP